MTVAMVFSQYLSCSAIGHLPASSIVSIGSASFINLFIAYCILHFEFLTLVNTAQTESTVTWSNRDTHSCTARAIDSAVEPVSLTLSKVTLGRSSSSLSLLMCLGDRPLWSACAVRTGHRCRIQVFFYVKCC